MNKMESKKEVKPIPDSEAVNLEELRKRKFLEKHPPKTDTEIEEQRQDRERAKTKYTRDIQRIEENLTTFFQKDFPLINPEDGEVLCWVKDIQYFKLLQMFPDDMLVEMEKPQEEIDMLEFIVQLREGYADHIFRIMAEIITIPKHDWEWWKENSNQMFIDLFNKFLEERIIKMNDEISFF